MKNYISSINKFSTPENLFFQDLSEHSFFIDIEKKLRFFDPSPEFRKFMLLNQISENNKISQSELSKNINVVPAMVNKYISGLRKNGQIMLTGNNNKAIRYYLTTDGENSRQHYLSEFINEILILYKEIKKEIKTKLLKISEYCIGKKILLYGANEISELIISVNAELNYKIIGIADANAASIKQTFGKYKLFSPSQLNKIRFDTLIITSLSKSSEIYLSIKHLKIKGIQTFLFAKL